MTTFNPLRSLNNDELFDKERLQSFYDHYDTEKINKISFQNVSKMLNKIFEEKERFEVSRENLWLLERRGDLDSDGMYSFQEFTDLVVFLAKMRINFDKIDANRSNRVSSRELSAAYKKIGFQFSKKTIRILVRLFDDDESKGLEFEEFINLSLYLRALQNLFTKRDENANQRIDRQELIPLLKDIGIRVSKRKARELLTRCNEDNSGELRFEEFVSLVFRAKYGHVKNLRIVNSPKVEIGGGTIQEDWIFKWK